jgi:P4 family phage/plasmid primase-like protien
MSIELSQFLSNKRKTDDNVVTHIVYDKSSTLKGSYNINKSDVPGLYDILVDIRNQGGTLSILERLDDICPLVIDLDFKYKDNISERQYTNETLEKLCSYIFKKINELYNLTSDNQSHAWIMEKPTISACNRSEYPMKDGLHILFPNIISEKKTYIKLIENIVNDKDTIDKLFEDTCSKPPSNPINEIFDTSIYRPGNWFIYGSGKPGDLIYELTNIFKINENNINKLPIDIYLENPREIINKNSVQLNNDINVIYKGPEILKKKTPIRTVSSQIDLTDIENMENIIKIKQEGLSYAKKLVNILSVERASDCKTWVDVGYCLHSIAPNHLLKSWINFSKKWIGYCNQDECEKQWDYMNTTNNPQYTMGTLIFWAKQDNPSEYDRIQKESLQKLVDNSLKGEKTCGAHTDVANVAFNYYKELFVCSGLKDNAWFYFNEITGRWQETEQGIILRRRLSADIIDIYQHYSNYYKDKRGDDPDSETYEINDRKHTNCMKVMIKLKDSSYKDKIMKECREQFYDSEFMDKLNSKKNLIGFDNGVIDLKYETIEHNGNIKKESIFRQGRPDDYVSLSVGYSLPVDKCDMPVNVDKIKDNIVHINDYDSLNSDLDDFIEKVLPNSYQQYEVDDNWEYILDEDGEKIPTSDREKPGEPSTYLDSRVRDYTLRFLASCLSGEVREEKFYFWTGSGANGKSKITDLITSTLGGYSKTMDVAFLTTKRGSSSSASPELEAIRYARFVSMSEPERDDQIYVGKLKQITGGDTMTSRGLFKDTTEFKPQFKLMLMCNELPKLAGNDGGVHRRIEVVDFISKFTDNPRPSTNNPHQYKADLELGTKLKKWNILFMIKLLDYYIKYDKEGTKAPPSVTEATKVYITENDVIQKWIANALEESGEVTPIDDLMENLKSWCEDEGYDFKKVQKQEVKKVLIKEQEKTSYGPPVFGKKVSDGMPNGTKTKPKFNFKSIDDN